MRFFVFVFAAVNSGLVSIAGFNAGQINWYQAATLGFLSGFSEPFFLGLIKRFGTAPARAGGDKPAVVDAESPRTSQEVRAIGRRLSNVRIAAIS